MSDDKTEEPSEQKLRKAREKGEVAKSTDIVEVACLGSMLLVLQSGERFFTDSLHAVVKSSLDFMSGPRSMDDLYVTLADMTGHALGMLCGVAVVALLAAIVALAPQVGLMVSFEAIAPKFNAVNPSSGLQKIFSMNSLIDLAKMTVKGVLIVAVMKTTIVAVMPVVASALDQPLPQLIHVLWSVVQKVLATALGVFVVIAAVDYKLQKMQFVKKQKMSKDEVKREHKENDGDQEVKGERKKLAREFASEAPGKGLKRANVVVVNPVHYAVALRYDPSEFPLPVVIAKGVDSEALLLRRQAAHLGIPIVANPPVARMLHKVAENQPIPEELYEVVAAILRWVTGLGAKTAITE
ncbi:type III secretion system export apparatus subunit SctU [Paraburkholderia sp.]|uniref:type III secretion system export apparatus subunit SctU n=1 Tax=Paraburkholderia sp. TaxID=1926495 RepID=UPI003D6FA8BB